MFPARLTRLEASRTVRSMTPKDLQDLRTAFSFNPERVGNKKVQALTTEDLHTLEALFRDHRMEVVATYRAMSRGDLPTGLKVSRSGCCSCSPSSCSTPPDDDDGLNHNPF